MQKSLIEDLQELGLNVYEAKVYLAIIERSSMNTAEITQVSGVPRARTYDILDNLVRRGLASLKPGKQKRYSAIDIDIFRQRLIADNREESLKREQKIDKIARELKTKIAKIYTPENQISDPLQYIEIIKNPMQIHKRFQQLTVESKKEILILTKPPYAGNQTQVVEQFRQQARLMKRGVKVKSIYEIPKEPAAKNWWIQVVNKAVEAGEDARAIDELPMKLAIFDEQIVLYTLEDPVLRQSSVTTMIIEHRSLAKSLKMLFNNIWSTAMDYHSIKKEGGA